MLQEHTMSFFCLILFVGVLSASAVIAGQVFVFQSTLVGIILPKSEAIPAAVTTYNSYLHDRQASQNECNCKPFNMCNTYLWPSGGVGLIDLRMKLGPCPSYLDVCCRDEIPPPIKSHGSSHTDHENGYTHHEEHCTKEPPLVHYNKPATTAETVTPTTTSTTVEPIEYETESPVESDHPKKTYSSWNKNGVGFKVINTLDGEAQYGEFPSMIAIFKKEVSIDGEINLVYHCGGSLLEPNVIVTAAHCVINKDPLKLVVRAGEWDLQREKELFPHQDRRVKKIVVHPEYYSGGLFNDIALIFTDKDFIFQKHIDNMFISYNNDYDKSVTCFAIGWGKSLSYNNYSIVQNTRSASNNEIRQYEFNILKKVELKIIKSEKCTEALKTTRLGPEFELHDSFICAGGEEGRDTCKGDGGGPLMCPDPRNPENLLQVGIVSWGINCGLAGIPGVYVDVSKFTKWIYEQINYHYE